MSTKKNLNEPPLNCVSSFVGADQFDGILTSWRESIEMLLSMLMEYKLKITIFYKHGLILFKLRVVKVCSNRLQIRESIKMFSEWLKDHRKGLIASVATAVYIKYLLLPTATFFFEAYHLLKIEFLYVGYQVFKVAGYAMSVWEHKNLTLIGITVFVFLIYALVRKLRAKSTCAQEVI